MLENYSEMAREAIDQAQIEANAMGHAYVGTQHLLLAISQTHGMAAKILGAFNLSHDQLKNAISARLEDYSKSRTIGWPMETDKRAHLMTIIDLFLENSDKIAGLIEAFRINSTEHSETTREEQLERARLDIAELIDGLLNRPHTPSTHWRAYLEFNRQSTSPKQAETMKHLRDILARFIRREEKT